MRVTDARLRYTGTSLLLAIGTLLSAVAHAGAGVWTSGGPYGAPVTAVAIDPANPATLYAGTGGRGIFKSTDAGASWTTANIGLSDLFVTALAIYPTAPATLYAGTGRGVFRTTDSGRTWVAAGLTNIEIYSLAVDPTTPGTVYAGMWEGIYKTTDFGDAWIAVAVNTGLLYVYALTVDPANPTTLYAGTGSFGAGVEKSTDGGTTWKRITPTLSYPDLFLPTFALALDPTAPNTLYAGTKGHGVYKSTDAGATWTAGSAGLTGVTVSALAIDPKTPTTLYAGSPEVGTFKSIDAGGSWTTAKMGLTSLDVSVLAVDPSTPSTLYTGTAAGIFKSTDGGAAWVAASTGLGSLSVHALAVDQRSPASIFAGTPGGAVFKSTDSGRTWNGAITGLLNAPDIYVLAISPADPTTVYAGTNHHGVYKSTDAGATWTAAATGLPTLPGDVNALVIDPANPTTLYAGMYQGKVFKSTDAGGTWKAANIGLTNPNCWALAIDPANTSTLYAGTGDGVFKSTNAGGTWTSASTGLVANVRALVIDPANPATLYAGADQQGGVFKSTDSSGTWAAVNTGLVNVVGTVHALVINPSTPATLYAGTDGGVFKSTDAGGTWAAINADLPHRSVQTVALDPTGPTTLYAALEGSGVWQWTPLTGIQRFVPIVLDVVGLAHYTSELQLTNLGASSATLMLSYTNSMGSGTGDVEETVPAGQQVVYPDVISYLRFRGVPIPASGNQGGTLLVSAPAGGVHATVRTSADMVAPQPAGRAGLAYTDTDPTASPSTTKMYVYGLRTSDTDRSNLAIYNMGQEPAWFQITLISGDDGRSFGVTAGGMLILPPYGWYQYSGVLNAAGFSSGYAIIERWGGGEPFGAYGVVNDRLTNDGSFIPAQSGTLSGSKLTIPVLVETNAFESELILTNRGSATATFTLRYFESLSPAKGPGGTTTVDVAAARQLIIPKAIDFLRSKGINIGARAEASYAGGLQVQVSGVDLESVFAGARTSSLSPAGGEFGVFYPGIGSSQEFSEIAFVLGLKSDVNNRSNVALLHTGDGTSGPITLELQVLDGSEGGMAAGQPLSVTLNPGQWAQPSGFFAGGGVPNGYVRIRRTAGAAPWFAYGVINDGGQPGQRTGDGSYVPGVQP